MIEVFNSLINDFNFTGNLQKDTYNFLIKHNRYTIAEHSIRVARKSKVLAKKFGANESMAEMAGLLHDIGGVYPNEIRIEIANRLGIEVLEEEEQLPLILHQRISKVMAKEIFNINDFEILNAIECHSTLRASASLMDMILFVADKVEWDQNDLPPYIDRVEKALNESIELAAFEYIRFLFESKESLKVVHPWLKEAYLDLGKAVNILDKKGELR
jgi:predicted HD superfamily hydrolase involved in NAD metabolism